MAIDQDAFGHTSVGLERAEIHVYTSVEAKTEAAHEGRSPVSNSRRLSKKLRSVFHHESKDITPSDDPQSSESKAPVPILAPTPPSTSEKDRFSVLPETSDLPSLKDFVKSPLQTAKSLAHAQGGNDFAENLAKSDAPHEASVQVVRAYDKLNETTRDSDEEYALKELELLKKGRADSYVRWTLDRHITKVGRIEAYQTPIRTKKDFLLKNDRGREVMQWQDYGTNLLLSHVEKHGGRYIGVSSDLPEPTEKALMAACERLILNSTPLQELFLRMRRLAHWEDPIASAALMTIYFTLLYYDYIVRALLFLAILLVIRQRYFPRTIEDLRQELTQSEDQDAVPTNLPSHIDQHGGKGWVEPLIERAGPTMLSHLEDMADFLEILRNFYEWRDPPRTAFTLCIFMMLWVILNFTPLWLLVKGSLVAAGFSFFVLMPLAHKYPKYHLLMSPTIYMFWKIPTHAEWAIARLQAEGTQKLKPLRNNQSSPSPAPSHTAADKEAAHAPPIIQIGRYRCISSKRHGKLHLSTSQVSFETSPSSTEKWHLRYEDMRSMRKAPSSSSMKQGSDLIFTDMQGHEFHISGLTKRDEIFTQIIGYSNVQWQRTG